MRRAKIRSQSYWSDDVVDRNYESLRLRVLNYSMFVGFRCVL